MFVVHTSVTTPYGIHKRVFVLLVAQTWMRSSSHRFSVLYLDGFASPLVFPPVWNRAIGPTKTNPLTPPTHSKFQGVIRSPRGAWH